MTLLSTSLSIKSKATSPSSLSSDARRKRMRVNQVKNIDWISALSDDVLLMILKRLSTEEAIRTSVLSRRWVGVWKQMTFLLFDMQKTVDNSNECVIHRSRYIAKLITKVIDNHNGRLEGCRIYNYVSQLREDATLETWARSLTHVKHTKDLSLQNINDNSCGARELILPPKIFSHPTLKSLSLSKYNLTSALAFNNCHNLTTLKLEYIRAENIDVFNTIIALCPFLKILVLDNVCLKIILDNPNGCLKIHNDNLKLLHIASTSFTSIHVSAALLDIFSIGYLPITADGIVLEAPRLMSIKNTLRHVSYNISSNAQDKVNIAHDLIVTKGTNYLRWLQTLAVSFDLTNPIDVYRLNQVLGSGNGRMRELEILFKHNNVPKEERESSICGTKNEKREEETLYLNAKFLVKIVRIHNFSGSNKEEFALASQLVTQKIVTQKIMIKTSSVLGIDKVEIEAAVAKLMELPKGNEWITIECF